MALSIKQHKAGDTGTAAPASTLASLDTPSTAGNTLVLAVASDAYITAPPPGWTLNANSSNMTYFGQYVYTKVATGGELSWTITPNSSASLAWVVLEIAGAATPAFDLAAAQYTQTFGSTYTTPTLTPTAGERLLLAVFAASLNGTSLRGVSGWTNAFSDTTDSWTKKTSGTNDMLGIGAQVVIADGTTGYNTGIIWDNAASPQARGAILLSLKGVVGANLAPTANAGSNRTVAAGRMVTLNGLGSTDGEGTVNGYQWQQLSGTPVTLLDAQTATPRFTAPTADTLLVFSLTVTDNEGATSAQTTVSITVSAGIEPSVATVRLSGAWLDKPLYTRHNGSWKS
ncbi:MAG TPA: PKD domain-containing protein [Candidatus Saccharimonadales bacterium]|nr:PKD domain-containing protein [Candidatus Saccharimonadales bacterium]